MLTTDTFLTGSNLMSLARQIAANGIIGVGYTFCLASDSVDLSAGYMMCMIGIISGFVEPDSVAFSTYTDNFVLLWGMFLQQYECGN